MHKKNIAIVFDCGATNVRVIAINTKGQILASHNMPNETDEDPNMKGGRIWDLEKLWGKLFKAAKIVTSNIDTSKIAGVTVTTFGVDGTFVDKNGEILYPIISWQCERTTPIMNAIDKYLPLEELYQISGVYPYAFNTINKFIWFNENKPEVMEQAHRFLFIPSLIIQKLSNAQINDITMLGTSMMSDIGARNLSEKILDKLDINREIFGEFEEPGGKAGEMNAHAAQLTGIPENTPVFLGGHDTQFAIYGSGAELNQPVLSSGTWEILMTRSSSYSTGKRELQNNLTTELDPTNGVYNIGQNWLGSGVLEWFSSNFYPELSGDELYQTMIKQAEEISEGAGGVLVDPAFYDDGSSKNAGTITGLTINTKRSQIYRAFLEGLAFRTREGLNSLEKAGKFKATSIICVGGGSKNALWNQLRADVCNVPIHLIDQKETTVLGASMFVFAGAGLFKSSDDARKSIKYNTQIIYPSDNRQVYDSLYQNYIKYKKN